jgi:hypothetical protein
VCVCECATACWLASAGHPVLRAESVFSLYDGCIVMLGSGMGQGTTNYGLIQRTTTNYGLIPITITWTPAIYFIYT